MLKVIKVVVNDYDINTKPMMAAIQTATSMGAQVHAVYCAAPVGIRSVYVPHPEYATAGQAPVLADSSEKYLQDEEIQMIQSRVSNAVTQHGLEFRFSVYYGDEIDGLIEHSRLSDLLVMGSDYLAKLWTSPLSHPLVGAMKDLMCPLLVVHPDMTIENMMDNVMLNWESEDTGYLACKKSLPLLEKVEHLSVFDGSDEHGSDDRIFTDLVDYLSRHELKDVVFYHASSELNPEKQDSEWGMVVLGVSHRNRITELVTKDSIVNYVKQSSCPVLLA